MQYIPVSRSCDLSLVSCDLSTSHITVMWCRTHLWAASQFPWSISRSMMGGARAMATSSIELLFQLMPTRSLSADSETMDGWAHEYSCQKGVTFLTLLFPNSSIPPPLSLSISPPLPFSLSPPTLQAMVDFKMVKALSYFNRESFILPKTEDKVNFPCTLYVSHSDIQYYTNVPFRCPILGYRSAGIRHPGWECWQSELRHSSGSQERFGLVWLLLVQFGFDHYHGDGCLGISGEVSVDGVVLYDWKIYSFEFKSSYIEKWVTPKVWKSRTLSFPPPAVLTRGACGSEPQPPLAWGRPSTREHSTFRENLPIRLQIWR